MVLPSTRLALKPVYSSGPRGGHHDRAVGHVRAFEDGRLNLNWVGVLALAKSHVPND